MKHCKNCENCIVDPMYAYIKGIDFHKCIVDGHHIDEPYWEKCEKYSRDFQKKDRYSSFLYQLVELVKRNRGL